MAFQDSALRKAFPNGLNGEIARGASGTTVVAIQYALEGSATCTTCAMASLAAIPKTR